MSTNLVQTFIKLTLYDTSAQVKIYSLKTLAKIWKEAPEVIVDHEKKNQIQSQNASLKNTILDIFDRCLLNSNHLIRFTVLSCFVVIQDVVDSELCVKELITLSIPLLLDENR